MTIGSPLSLALLLISTAWVVAFFVWGVGHGAPLAERTTRQRTVLLIGIAWLGLTFALGTSGVLAVFDSTPPRPLPFFAVTAIATISLGLSRFGRAWARRLPVAALLLFHVYRIVVELMLWSMHRDGVANQVQTFEGRNFDVVTGVAALILGLLAMKRSLPRWSLWLFNVVGLGLLVHVVVVAVLAMPTSFRVFMEGPANTAVASAPYIWLPTVLVLAALFGHVVFFVRLRQRS